MTAWFQALSWLEQVFALCAIPATIVLVLQTLLLLLGLGDSGGSDTDLSSDVSGMGDAGDLSDMGIDFSDFDMDIDGIPSGDSDIPSDISVDTGLRLFTVRGLVTFFTLFGWTGLVCSQAEYGTTLSIFVSFLAGAAGMFITAYIMKAVTKMQSDGTLDLRNAVGKSAAVYIRVPASRTGKGKVNIILQERLIELSAVTDEKTDLPTDSEVVVVGLSGGDTLLVSAKKT